MPSPKILIVCLQPIHIRELGLQLRAGEVREVEESSVALKSIKVAVEKGAIRIRRQGTVRSQPGIPAIGGILQGARQPGGTALHQPAPVEDTTTPIVLDTSALEATVQRLESTMRSLFEGMQQGSPSSIDLKGLEDRIASLSAKFEEVRVRPSQGEVSTVMVDTTTFGGPSEVSYIPDDLGKTSGPSNVHIAEEETSTSTSDIAASLKKLKKKGK